MHHRAAEWFEQAGLIGEAISHAIDAEDEDYALELLEQGGSHLINTGYTGNLNELVNRMSPSMVEGSVEILEQIGWLEVLNSRYKH